MTAFKWPKGLGDEPEPRTWEDGKSAREMAKDGSDKQVQEQQTATRLKAEPAESDKPNKK